MSLFPAGRENVIFEGYLKNMTEWHKQSSRTFFKKNIREAIRPCSSHITKQKLSYFTTTAFVSESDIEYKVELLSKSTQTLMYCRISKISLYCYLVALS